MYAFLVRWEHHITYSGVECRSRQPGKCPAVLLGFGEIDPPSPSRRRRGVASPATSALFPWDRRLPLVTKGSLRPQGCPGSPVPSQGTSSSYSSGGGSLKAVPAGDNLGIPPPFRPLSHLFRSFCPVRHVMLVTLRADNELIRCIQCIHAST